MQNCLRWSGHQPPALPGRFAPYVQSSVALVVCWRCGLCQALCAWFQLVASPCILCVPRPPLGLACFAASPTRSARPPPRGSLRTARRKPPDKFFAIMAGRNRAAPADRLNYFSLSASFITTSSAILGKIVSHAPIVKAPPKSTVRLAVADPTLRFSES